MNIKKDTIVRLVVLALALVNQILTACGKNILPIEEETLAEFISTALTVAAAAWGFWKNNSFTAAAIEADEKLAELKGK